MKNTTIHLMLATAALLVASTAASAQSMKANVPFAFRAAGKAMPAGEYSVRGVDSESKFMLRNNRSGESVILTGAISNDPKTEWKANTGGVVEFACYDGCVVSTIWTANGYPAHRYTKSTDGKAARLATIRLSVDRSK